MDKIGSNTFSIIQIFNFLFSDERKPKTNNFFGLKKNIYILGKNLVILGFKIQTEKITIENDSSPLLNMKKLKKNVLNAWAFDFDLLRILES